jgi:trans-aconitate methyltransferase
LPLPVKVAVFGALVGGFVLFNAWAVPRMIPKRPVPSFESILPTLGARDVFVELGCGDGKAVIAAAQHFAQAHGCDSRAWILRLARKNAATINNVTFHPIDQSTSLLVASADCVLVSNGDEVEVRKQMRAGAVLLLQLAGSETTFVADKV